MGVSHFFSDAVPNWTGTITGFNSQGSTTTIAATNMVRPQDWNSAHNQLIQLSGNTINASTVGGTDVVLYGSDGIYLGGSTNSLIIGNKPVSSYRPFSLLTTTNIGQGNSLVSIQPFVVRENVAVSNAKVAAVVTITTTSNTSSAWIDWSATAVIYTRNASTLSYLTSLQGTGTTFWQSNSTSSVTGAIGFELTGAVFTLQASDYFMALHFSTTNSATGGANSTLLNNAMTMILGATFATNLDLIHSFGQQTNNSLGLIPALGILSTGASRSSIAISDIVVTGTRGQVAPYYFELRNATFQ
jgi:hypothetical protein